MRVCGVICEYDPFHAGHAWHIARARDITGADYVLCVMSGAFTQRGMPALLPARARADMALRGGADVVLQAPYVCSVREAEHFALGFVAILNSLGCVTHLSFGTETTDSELLSDAARLLESRDPAFEKAVHAATENGRSYAQAAGGALEACLGERAKALRSPNAMLAVHYLRALIRLGSPILPAPVLRRGDYHDARGGDMPSATAVRAAILRGDWDNVRSAIPEASYPALERAMSGGDICYPDALDAPLRVKLLSMGARAIAALPEVSEGLENRILDAAKRETTRENMLARIKTRRYTHARLSRALCHALVGVTKDDFVSPYLYARVLGFRPSASPLLRALQRSDFPLVTRPARQLTREQFALDARADAVRHALSGAPCGAEYRESPLIIP